MNFSIGNLIEKIQPAVTGTHEFGYREKPKSEALLEFSEGQKSKARIRKTVFQPKLALTVQTFLLPASKYDERIKTYG